MENQAHSDNFPPVVRASERHVPVSSQGSWSASPWDQTAVVRDASKVLSNTLPHAVFCCCCCFKKIGNFLACLEEVKLPSFAGLGINSHKLLSYSLDLSDASDSRSGRRWISELCVVCTHV